MYIPDYQTIKFEQQERIDKVAHINAANRVAARSRTARRLERQADAIERRTRRTTQRLHRRRLLAMFRRVRTS